MKRSEMIENLVNAFNTLNGEVMGPDFIIKLANISLNTVEKAGMVPPPDQSTISPFGGHVCQWEYDGENHE